MSPASYQTAPPRDAAQTAGLLPSFFHFGGNFSGFSRFDHRVRASALPPRAGNGTRTRDPNLGKVVLYQLSYSREADDFSVPTSPAQRPVCTGGARAKRGHGGEGDRTPDLVNAIHALSQLSYAPAKLFRLRSAPRQQGNVARAAASVNDGYSTPAQPNVFVSTVIRRP